MNRINPKQELFCRSYTQNRAMFGNATLSYAHAYGYDLDSVSRERPVLEPEADGRPEKLGRSEYEKASSVCSTNGQRLLRNAEINECIMTLLNETVTENTVESELVHVIMQRKNLPAKVRAIKVYNRTMGRVKWNVA